MGLISWKRSSQPSFKKREYFLDLLMRELIKKAVEEGRVSRWTVFLKDEEIKESSV